MAVDSLGKASGLPKILRFSWTQDRKIFWNTVKHAETRLRGLTFITSLNPWSNFRS